ncbi:MAG: radical SAM protein [Acidobacteria bacterium]|nr:radical SAM protein [Acidobacteriota bacterium]
MSLLNEMSQKAFDLGVPISVHLDVTYRCNERCVHCYLDHDDHGEMTTAEMKGVLDQLADAGVFFLTFSGGEVFLRRDFFEILEYARRLQFNVKIKTNAVMIHAKEAKRIRDLGVDTIQISVYSHRAEVHDAITKLPGSFNRTIKAIRFMREQGLKVTVANVMMTLNRHDSDGVQALATELGAHYTLDPTITPMMDGNTDVLSLRIAGEELPSVFANPNLVPNMEEFCAPPMPVTDDDMEGYSCSAGHSFCYISPYGDVFPCVQFPLPTGNVRQQKFIDIWNHSPEMNEVRSIKAKDLTTCSSCSHVSSCTRCPGLAYMEGSMRGPSTADCEKSYYRTGIPSANMLRKAGKPTSMTPLVQIRPMAALAMNGD